MSRKRPASSGFEGSRNRKRKKSLVVNILILVVSLLSLCAGGLLVYADHMLGLINFNQEPGNVPPPQQEASGTSLDEWGNSQNTLNGLYHDDQVMNVLLMGVDDYQQNDKGRSDSMLMVSLDKRHEKLKMTSFMRDLYLQIPGYKPNKLTTAYSIGGPTLTVQTIENSFGVDIDRYVVISNDSFNRIIDRLGGVTITLTNEKDSHGNTEADLINMHSGDKKKVHTGTNLLSGKQAHYYSRIRDIGNDYERTARQRKVLESIINKFKTSNLATINGILYDVLPLVTTNMTKNEILFLAANSLTFLNYPTSQNRIPVDGAFDDKNIAGVGSSLIPDTEKNSKLLIDFIYENGASASLPSDDSSSSSGAGE
ncbi:LytR family transcriptional regulator [Ruminococcaceae bacterium BL-6]|nr:LytR family transcriptional regulator [Ruminococcaceae bacterium BL-6]